MTSKHVGRCGDCDQHEVVHKFESIKSTALIYIDSSGCQLLNSFLVCLATCKTSHPPVPAPEPERTKSLKDILQAASLISYFLDCGESALFNAAWRDAISRGKGWQSRAMEGKAALLKLAPELAASELWQS